MRKLTVEAFEDLSRPGGGHAVIRIRGLADVPDNLTFRLRPADGSSALDRPGSWPDGERRPLSTRVTPEGTELLIGPEIVESPHLLPGTLAILDIPKCGVRGEFLWPSIQTIARPKRRHVVATRTGRDGRTGIAGEAAPDADAEPIAFVEATDASSIVAPAATEADATEAAWKKALAEAPPPTVETAPTVAGPADIKPAGAITPAAATQGSRPNGPQWTEDAGTRKQRHGRAMQVALLALAFAAGAAAAVWLPWQPTRSGASAAPQTAGADANSRTTTTRTTETNELLALIDMARTSPGGFDASGADPLRLLERADVLLATPPTGPDLEEARYMLRRYLAVNFSQPRTLWALTQLGSLYAEPGAGRRPDYVRAAGAWEMAATLGDPIAMCFLAALQEHGLGVAADRPTALTWYLSAKAAGGCPGVDEAIGRLRR